MWKTMIQLSLCIYFKLKTAVILILTNIVYNISHHFILCQTADFASSIWHSLRIGKVDTGCPKISDTVLNVNIVLLFILNQILSVSCYRLYNKVYVDMQ